MKQVFGSAILGAICAVGLSGCGHLHKIEHPEAHALGENDRHAKIGSKEVATGDRVEIFKSVCKPGHIRPRGGAPIQECTSQKVGEATIVAVDSETSSVIRLDADAEFSNDLKVEKKK